MMPDANGPVGQKVAEEWRNIPGLDGYQASTLGRVRSVDRVGARGHRYKGRVLKVGAHRGGYRFAYLWKDGKKRNVTVHRLVAMTFLATDPNPERNNVNHKNGDKADNRVTNLEWVTYSENTLHAIRELGAKLPPLSPTCPVVAIKDGVELRFPSLMAADRGGFRQSRISDCLSGRQKTHKGYEWRRADVQ